MVFSYEDFKLFTKASDVDAKIFSIVAPAVLDLIKSTYGIYTESQNIVYKYNMSSAGTTFTLPISPINSITKITYDGVEQVYTYYGDDIVLSTSISDARKPLTIELNVGYTNVPDDLRLAVYSHIESLYFRITNSQDNIEKVVNSAGNTTFFKDDATPSLSKFVYNKYSNRVIALY